MRQPPMPALKNSAGAFDLPSIITGVVVVGILTAGVLAAIFGVIPFTQNNGAKQDLSAIRTAEGVARTKDNRFMDHQGLLDTGYLQLSSTAATKVKADEKGTCYVALAKSGTGKTFYATDAKTDPAILEADTNPGCLTDEELAELIEDVGGIEDDTPEGAPKNLKLTAMSPLQAKATWDPVKGATGYKVEYQVGDTAEWTTRHENVVQAAAAVSALPEETITVRVYALKGESVSEPSSASVKLPDSTLKNPSFELDGAGWTLGTGAKIYTATARTGLKSLSLAGSGVPTSQVITVPADTPVLTYWIQDTRFPPKFIGGQASPVRAENGWTQYKADLSSSIGKPLNIGFETNIGGVIVDDVALESAWIPDPPTAVTAYSSSGKATIRWAAPGFSGGAPLRSYTVAATLDGETTGRLEVGADTTAANMNGLNTGSKYVFTVTANNDIGASAASRTLEIEILPGAVANPSFELDGAGWTLGTGAKIYTATARTGLKSLSLAGSGVPTSQVITVPADTPVLTYWIQDTRFPPKFIGGQASPVRAENGWTQYKADLSSSIGKPLNIGFVTNIGGVIVDDVALESH